MAKGRVVPKRSGKPSLRPTRESRAGRRRGPIRGDLPHGEGGAGARAAEDTVFAAHPSAVIDPGAEIGAGTRIWHWSHVMTGARIGRGCTLGQNVFVGADVHIGDRVKISRDPSPGGWAIRPPRRKIGTLMPASCVDLPAHLCPNWGPATFNDERATTNGALPSDEISG